MLIQTIMKPIQEKHSILALTLITLFWGLTFPVIKDSVQIISPFTFISIRFLIGWMFIDFMGKKYKKLDIRGQATSRAERQAGVWVGLVLFAGYSLQTFGLQFTSSSNAGFLTGLSVVIVPVLLKIRGHRVGIYSWIGILLSLIGVGLLSIQETMTLNSGDLLVIACAIAFGLHIVLVGHYAREFNPIRLAKNQILVCAVLSTLAALVLERKNFSWDHFKNFGVIASILFCGILATGTAFLVQNVFQKHTTAVKTALIFTCEPVFAAIFAVLISSETMTMQQIFGGALMVIAMIVAEVGPALVSNLFKLPHR
jgi:drug/metabolite transporter (DMT)-like permease